MARSGWPISSGAIRRLLGELKAWPATVANLLRTPSATSDPENYVRRCDAPVDVRALATDAIIVLQEAYGVTPDRTISVRSAVAETTVP